MPQVKRRQPMPTGLPPQLVALLEQLQMEFPMPGTVNVPKASTRVAKLIQQPSTKANLPAELVAVGDEAAYNAVRPGPVQQDAMESIYQMMMRKLFGGQR